MYKILIAVSLFSIVSTFQYNKIAEWHNDDGSSPGLKQLSFDVVKDVTDLVCEHFEIPFNSEIKIDELLKGEASKKEDVK